jgi:hypothetical protein
MVGAYARIPEQQVQRAAAEKELVRDAIHRLAAKAPGVELDRVPVWLG